MMYFLTAFYIKQIFLTSFFFTAQKMASCPRKIIKSFRKSVNKDIAGSVFFDHGIVSHKVSDK